MDILKRLSANICMLLMALVISCQVFAVQPDDILGIWMVPEKDAKIEISKNSQSKYVGKIIWLEVPNDDEGKPRKDINNKSEELRNRPVLGIEVVNNFSFNEAKKQWDGGEVYNSRDGKVYAGYMRINDDGTLMLRGHVKGFKFLGKTNTWTRTTR
jgi:uncharacterized protein (DUF2147 family)